MNISFDTGGSGELVLLEFPMVMAVFAGSEWQQAEALTEQRLVFQKGGVLGFACRGFSRTYAIQMCLTSAELAGLALRQHPETGAIQLLACQPVPGRYEFVLSVSPILGDRLLLGSDTNSLTESSFVYVIYPPLGPGNLHWITCLLQPTSVPLSYRQRVINRYPIPYMGFTTEDGKKWVLGRHQPEGDWRELAVCLIGRPTSSQVDALLETQLYRRIYLVTDDEDLLARYIVPTGARSLAHGGGELTTVQVSDTQLVLAGTDWTAANLEDMNIQMMQAELAEPRYTHFYRESWQSVVSDRLPSVPVVPDPRVGSMCVLINLVRGRVPDTTPEALEDCSGIFDDRLWLVPWEEAERIEVTQLTVELIARSSSEYTALRYFGDLALDSVPDTAPPIPEDECSALRTAFDAWLRAVGGETTAPRASLREGLLRTGMSTRSAVSLLADHIYRMDPDDRHAANLSFTNPFVITLIANEMPWEQLSLDLAYWTMYAACSSRSKVGAIATAFVGEASIGEIKEALQDLRVSYHVSGHSDSREQICERRRVVGRMLEKAVGPSVLASLDRVGTDRVVAFSDVGLEHLPYRDGVLGMEVPLSRLPASWPAMETVGNAVRSATVGQSTVRGGQLTRGSKATIIVAERETDFQTGWSREIALAAQERLRWVGLVAEMASAPTGRELLESCAPAAVVLFFGHATASGGRAFLSLGEDKSITVSDVLECDWSGKLIVLIGCETAVQDAEESDIASAFLQRGARAVVGTSAKVSVAVADYIFTQMFDLLIEGMPIDYAFFLARRRAAAFETLRATMSAAAAAQRIADAVGRGAERGYLGTFLDELGLQWADMEQDSVYAPTFSLLGGGGETLV